MSRPEEQFATLGKHLKYVREKSQESLAETSGAVEIEEQRLQRIEAGEERPAEDILLLLISHFNVHEQEAVQLWELADYDSDIPEQIKPEELQTGNRSTVMLLALDMRTMYSDGLEISSNNAGLTLNYTQASGPSQAIPVARIGMSYEQAEQVLHKLQLALLKAKYHPASRLLPPAPADE